MPGGRGSGARYWTGSLLLCAFPSCLTDLGLAQRRTSDGGAGVRCRLGSLLPAVDCDRRGALLDGDVPLLRLSPATLRLVWRRWRRVARLAGDFASLRPSELLTQASLDLTRSCGFDGASSCRGKCAILGSLWVCNTRSCPCLTEPYECRKMLRRQGSKLMRNIYVGIGREERM